MGEHHTTMIVGDINGMEINMIAGKLIKNIHQLIQHLTKYEYARYWL
jgi:hypothetical protein